MKGNLNLKAIAGISCMLAIGSVLSHVYGAIDAGATIDIVSQSNERDLNEKLEELATTIADNVYFDFVKMNIGFGKILKTAEINLRNVLTEVVSSYRNLLISSPLTEIQLSDTDINILVNDLCIERLKQQIVTKNASELPASDLESFEEALWPGVGEEIRDLLKKRTAKLCAWIDGIVPDSTDTGESNRRKRHELIKLMSRRIELNRWIGPIRWPDAVVHATTHKRVAPGLFSLIRSKEGGRDERQTIKIVAQSLLHARSELEDANHSRDSATRIAKHALSALTRLVSTQTALDEMFGMHQKSGFVTAFDEAIAMTKEDAGESSGEKIDWKD